MPIFTFVLKPEHESRILAVYLKDALHDKSTLLKIALVEGGPWALWHEEDSETEGQQG